MRIWYDACTGKHVRYGTAIARRLRKSGHEVVFTTRDHPDTLRLAKSLGENPIVIGKYDPRSLLTRLQESTSRMLGFAELFKNGAPDAAISSQSVELCRFAFGLGVPMLLTADTPHATAVNRLTIPLANTLLASEAIPRRLFEKYGAQKILQFKGVDELAWIKNSGQSSAFGFRRPLIVVRQMETRAAYALGKGDVTIRIAQRLASLGNVLFLPRYIEAENEKLKVMEGFVDSARLAAQSDLVVSVGGTIAREAALQGTPSIVISEFVRIQVNEYLSKKGFPLFIVSPSRVLSCAKKYLGKRFDVKVKLGDMENPVDIIEKMVAEKSFT